MSSDFLFVKNLELPCRVGITAEERAFPQVLSVSVKIELPLDKAGKSDDLKNTLDYAAIIHDIRESTSQKEFNLVESIAETIAAVALKSPLAKAVEVSVGKKVFSGIESVGATIWRAKKPA